MAYRLIRGVSQRESPLVKDLFEGFTQQTEFLTLEHTRKWYRQEHTYPEIIDRDTYDTWVSLGKKSLADRASEEVEKRLRNKPPNLLDQHQKQELKQIMLTDANANDVTGIPELPD